MMCTILCDRFPFHVLESVFFCVCFVQQDQPSIPLRNLQHILLSSSVHVCQLLKARTPLPEAVVVLVPTAGGVEGRQGAGVRAFTLVIEDEEGVVGGRQRVVVCCRQVLKRADNTVGAVALLHSNRDHRLLGKLARLLPDKLNLEITCWSGEAAVIFFSTRCNGQS